MQCNASVSFHPDGSIASISAPSIGDLLYLLNRLRNPHQYELPISDEQLPFCKFSIRTRKALARLGISTIRQLAQKTPNELMSMKNFGDSSLKEIRLFLRNRGLHLGLEDSMPLVALDPEPVSSNRH